MPRFKGGDSTVKQRTQLRVVVGEGSDLRFDDGLAFDDFPVNPGERESFADGIQHVEQGVFEPLALLRLNRARRFDTMIFPPIGVSGLTFD